MAYNIDKLARVATDGVKFFTYTTTDSRATVTGSGYFGRAAANGMNVGDRIDVTNSSSGDAYVVEITSVETAGGATGKIAERIDTTSITSATITTLSATNIDAGASGTAGSVDVFPSTASKGKLSVTAADSAGNTTTTIVNASQAAARTYTIPDAGASASFMMTEGTQTVNGDKTFGNKIIMAAGATIVPDWTSGAATAGAISFNKMAGIVTSEDLTTAAGADYTLTVTNTKIDVNTIAVAALRTDGTNAAGTPRLVSVTPGSSSLVIVVHNDHASAAFNGTLKIAFIAFPSA